MLHDADMTNPNPYVRPLFVYKGSRETLKGCTLVRLTDGSNIVMEGDTTPEIGLAITAGKVLVDRAGNGEVNIMHPSTSLVPTTPPLTAQKHPQNKPLCGRCGRTRHTPPPHPHSQVWGCCTIKENPHGNATARH